MIQLRTLTLLAIAPLLFSGPTGSARWAGPKDAPSVTEDEKVEINVASDFTYQEVQLSRIRVLNEEGRRKEGVRRLNYNSRASTLTVLEAWTESSGRKILVEAQDIQDKPLASARDGFDQLNQLTIAFPAVEEGAILHLKTVRKVSEIPFEGFFSTSLISGLWSWDKKAEATVRAPFPLFHEENDPDDFLDVRARSSAGATTIQVRLKRPIHFRVVDEENVHFLGERLPRVTISSSRNWQDMIRMLAPGWEQILASPLPAPYLQITKKASNQNSPEAQIDSVTSQLAGKIRYWADWRPIRGGHIPRKLDSIAKTGFGDCKDFAASTVAMLRNLGFEALPVFIQRSSRPVLRPGKLPYDGDFNHAIVHAAKDGKEYWIDPTNQVSFATGTFEDIIDRPALLIDGRSHPPSARLLQTPPGVPDTSLQKMALTTSIDPDGERTTRGTLDLAGRATLRWAGDGLSTSEDSLKYQLITLLANDNRLLKWSANLPDLKARIARPLAFGFNFSESGDDVRTSSGPAIQLRQGSLISSLLTRTEDRESDLWLGWPIEVKREQRIAGVKLIGDRTLSCELNSRWANITRTVHAPPDTHLIDVTDEVQLKRPVVLRNEYAGKEWQEFQRGVRSCFDRVAVVYEPIRK